MKRYEKLEDEAFEEGVDVIDYNFISSDIRGLYMDNTIALSKKVRTSAEKSCIIAEEMGHYYTSYGNIIDQKDVMNRKQEYRARVWACEKLLHLRDLISAYNNKCTNRYEVAEFLEVTEEFLEDAIGYFTTQYPNGCVVDDYHIQFIPNLKITKLI